MSVVIRTLVLAGCALLMLNLVGTDPSDIVFAGTVALILMASPGSVLLDGITLPTRVVLAMIIGFYAISCSFGSRSPSFILYFISGLMFSISLCWAVSISDRLQIGLAMFGGTLGLNLASILLWANGYWTDDRFFDLFRDGRFMGPSGDPNMTGLSGAFALYYFADRALRPNASRVVLFASIMGVIVAAAIILTSGSRAAWGASLVGLAVLFILSRKLIGGQAVVVGTVTALGMAVLSSGVLSSSANVEDFSERFQTLFVQDRSAEQERFEFVYTRAALDVAADHPLGIGPGMTPFYTGISSVDGDPIGAHNSYVEIATENGWPMAVLLFGLLLVAGRRIYALAEADVFLNDISCRTVFAGLSATAVFGFGHDLLGWRVGWIFPILAILAAFSTKYRAVMSLKAVNRS